VAVQGVVDGGVVGLSDAQTEPPPRFLETRKLRSVARTDGSIRSHSVPVAAGSSWR